MFHGIVIHWWNANCNVNSGLSHFERWMRVSLRAHFYILKCKNMHADASMSTAQNNLDLNYILRIVKVKQQCDSKVWFLLHDTYLISISVKVGSETNEKDSRLTKKVKKNLPEKCNKYQNLTNLTGNTDDKIHECQKVLEAYSWSRFIKPMFWNSINVVRIGIF